MMNAFSEFLFAPMSELIGRELGLHFTLGRASDLQRGIAACAGERGFADSEDFARWLLSRPLQKAEKELLARHLTVGETYFFRDGAAFDAIEREVLPELVRQRRGEGRRLRIWSAACCSGEEAYSLAICVRRAIPDLADWRVTILGTDINPQFLDKAARGVFGEWSFRDTPPELRDNYFKKTAANQWEILPELRRMVTFVPLNLATDVYPSIETDTGDMDLVFCRNALIYFAPDRAASVVERLGRCLAKSGWLVLGPSEVSYGASALAPVSFPGTVLHAKDARKERAEQTPMPSAIGKDGWAEVEMAWIPVPSSAESTPREGIVRDRERETTPASVEAVRETADSRTSIMRARALANQGELPAALAALDDVLRGDKMNHRAHYLRAGILQELDDRTESARALQRALYLEPDFVLAHFALGNLARAQGQVALADRHLDTAFALARARPPEEILPDSDGLTAARLAEIVTALRATRAVA